MKRVLAVLLLLMGGLSAEVVNPAQCLLITNTRQRRVRTPDDSKHFENR
jgi:hypothetical protein